MRRFGGLAAALRQNLVRIAQAAPRSSHRSETASFAEIGYPLPDHGSRTVARSDGIRGGGRETKGPKWRAFGGRAAVLDYAARLT